MTGLLYLNARFYDPQTGRFITRDTYRGERDDAGKWHLYLYCANNPVNYVDPSGHYYTAVRLGYNLYRVARSAAVIGAFLSGLGGTVLIVTAVVGTAWYLGTKYSKVNAKTTTKKGSRSKSSSKNTSSKNKSAVKGISKKILKPDGKVDIGKFKIKLSRGQGFKGPDGYRIMKDKGVNSTKAQTHGGSFWKLFNSAGKRIATLAKDGKVLRR